jgi:hypothetical protein
MNRITGVPASRVIVPTAGPPVGAPGLVAQLQAPTPTPNRFYPLAQGDTFSDVARATLEAYQPGLGSSGVTRRAYMQCVTAGVRWNRRLYGSSYTSNSFPEYMLLDGLGLARAFYPWNDAAAGRLKSGLFPRRGFTEDGDKISGVGSSFALLWLPSIDGFQYHEGHWLPVCGELDPPALLLDALQTPPGRSR